MSAKTSIEWTNRTWNPVRGCSRVSEGCRNCYAERMAARFTKPGQWGEGFATSRRERLTGRLVPGTKEAERRVDVGARWTGRVELIPSALAAPLRWRGGSRVFVNSMSDLFHESLALADIAAVYAVMAQATRHTFQVLTKRPARRLEFVRWITSEGKKAKAGLGLIWPLPNVWEGTSVEDQATADVRIPVLLETPAAVRFVSYEPALGPVDFRAYVAQLDILCCPRCGFRTNRKGHGPCPNDGAALGPDIRIDWIIVGGESGPGARPFDVAWARSTVAACKAAAIPAFVKQLGAFVKDRNDAGFEAELETWADGPDAGRPTDPRAWPTPHGGVEDNLDGYRDDYQGAPVRVRLKDRKGGDPAEWPEALRVREFPS